jgi:molybdenum cofactor sulfurtransferase
MTATLTNLRHETNGEPVVSILSSVPTRRLKSVGEQCDTGAVVSLIFLSVNAHDSYYSYKIAYITPLQPTGEMLPLSFIEYAATSQSISLRTGCMCNPGGVAAMLDSQEHMKRIYPGVTLKDLECALGRELGVVRISLGLASTFQDVWKFTRFCATIGHEKSRQLLWDRFMRNSASAKTV